MPLVSKNLPKTRKLPRRLKEEAERLRNMPDSEIDYSDIPETDKNFWADAEIVEPDKKTMISIRVDSDVLNWYRRHAKRYQTLMNAVLRSYKEAREEEAKARGRN